jgi:hypothetical protein
VRARLESLIPGLNVLEATATVLHISDGTRRGKDPRSDGIRLYSQTSYVPRDTWRPLSESERRLLCRNKESRAYCSITHLQPPAEVRRACRLAPGFAEADFERAVEWAAMVQDEIIDACLPFVVELNRPLAPVFAHGIAVHYSNEITVTYDMNTFERIGLHIDSWDGMPLRERHKATNRIGFNLGPEPRWLVFVNIPVTTIVDDILVDPDSRFMGHTLPAQFFEEFPNYPIIRLRIEPGCGYIAPTENLIHDGSTWGSSHLGVSVFFRGYFSAPT